MKYILLVPDGMLDTPLEILNNKTPLEVASTPNLDKIAFKGSVGRTQTIPKGFPASSDVANMNILGLNPSIYYTGRGPLEAANLGIDLEPDDVAFRMNFVTIADGIMQDYSAGHIRDNETQVLIELLNEKLGSENLKFYKGKSYRNLCIFKKGKLLNLHKLKTFAPHDILGKKIKEFLPKGENSQIVLELMQNSVKLLEDHEINKVRIDLGENPANMIWLWGQGLKPSLPSFEEKFGIKGGLISAVDLLKGIGKLIGLKIIQVPGVTGFYDTNFEGKADYALKALEELDFVFIHLEAIDEASHNQDLRMKILCIEKFDKLILGKILKTLEEKREDFRLLVCPDHFTPLNLRTHTDWPVGFVIYGKGIPQDFIKEFNEKTMKESPLFVKEANMLMDFLIKGKLPQK